MKRILSELLTEHMGSMLTELAELRQEVEQLRGERQQAWAKNPWLPNMQQFMG
jgi:hypothetical protein